MTMTISNDNDNWQASTKGLNMFNTFLFPMRILFIPGYVHWKRIIIFFVAQLMPQSHCAEYTAEWGQIVHSSLYGWSFLVILAMTMTMTIHSKSVLLRRVVSADQYESFEHVQKICVPSTKNFHSCLCALETCSYRLCRTAYMLYSSRSHCILHHSCM